MSSSPGSMSGNTLIGLAPLTKVKYPTDTERKKRFSKIRQKIEGPK